MGGLRIRKDRAPPFCESRREIIGPTRATHRHLLQSILFWSDIPRPDDVVLQEIVDQLVFAEDLRTEERSEDTFFIMEINQ